MVEKKGKGKDKPAKEGGGGGGGKQKKKKWSKGKSHDKLNNLVLFDKATYDKLMKELPTAKLITPSTVSERFKVRASLARQVLKEMAAKNLIRTISRNHSQEIYTKIQRDDEPDAGAGAAAAQEKQPQQAKAKKGAAKKEEVAAE